MLPDRVASCSMSLSIPDSNGAIEGSGDDVLPLGRVSNGQHPISVPMEGIADWSTSLGIPDSNGTVETSGDDVTPIGRVSNGPYRVSGGLERIADSGNSRVGKEYSDGR